MRFMLARVMRCDERGIEMIVGATEATIPPTLLQRADQVVQ
jgi:hypothetical protein